MTSQSKPARKSRSSNPHPDLVLLTCWIASLARLMPSCILRSSTPTSCRGESECVAVPPKILASMPVAVLKSLLRSDILTERGQIFPNASPGSYTTGTAKNVWQNRWLKAKTDQLLFFEILQVPQLKHPPTNLPTHTITHTINKLDSLPALGVPKCKYLTVILGQKPTRPNLKPLEDHISIPLY